MKKKRSTFKLAGMLLVLVLVTSCFVGSTFAKYTTSQWGQDAARVAKFGVTITADGNMFNQEYTTNDSNVSGTIANSVVSTQDVIAPGTSGNLVSIGLSGTPEVAVKVTYVADVTLGNWTTKSGKYYCPLEIKIGDDTLKGTAFESADAFAQEIKAKVAAYSATYEAGTDLSATTVKTPSGSWSWPFESGKDAEDTELGNAADAASINLKVTTTVTQID